MRENLVVVDLDELAQRWEIPLERIQYLITDCGMNMTAPELWAAKHSEIVLNEKQIAFEDSLFPRHLRPPLPEPNA